MVGFTDPSVAYKGYEFLRLMKGTDGSSAKELLSVPLCFAVGGDDFLDMPLMLSFTVLMIKT